MGMAALGSSESTFDGSSHAEPLANADLYNGAERRVGILSMLFPEARFECPDEVITPLLQPQVAAAANDLTLVVAEAMLLCTDGVPLGALLHPVTERDYVAALRASGGALLRYERNDADDDAARAHRSRWQSYGAAVMTGLLGSVMPSDGDQASVAERSSRIRIACSHGLYRVVFAA